MNKNKIVWLLCIVIFGLAGIYLTFIVGNTSKYDSQTKAYKIEPNERYDGEDTLYRPIYYFKVDGREYECESKSSSSSYPNENKNMVYYDSTNPKKCTTQYEKSNGKFIGIVFLIITAIAIVLGIKNPDLISDEANTIDDATQAKIEANVERINATMGKIKLILNRILLSIIIFVLLIFILLDTMLLKQTIKARNYIETTATYVETKSESDTFDECIYTFEDNKGVKQEIVVDYSDNEIIKDEIKIKYNAANPQDYYGETSLLDKTGIMWYIVKIVAIILLIILFFNKKLLSKISTSVNAN